MMLITVKFRIHEEMRHATHKTLNEDVLKLCSDAHNC